MKKGDKVLIHNTEAVSQKTQKSLSGKKGRIFDEIPQQKGSKIKVYIVKVAGELLPFCSTELKERI